MQYSPKIICSKLQYSGIIISTPGINTAFREIYHAKPEIYHALVEIMPGTRQLLHQAYMLSERGHPLCELSDTGPQESERPGAIKMSKKSIFPSFQEFAYLCRMTYEETQILYDRLKTIAIGAPVKGRLIESLFIGPTVWEQMSDFMNLRIQKGEEAALIEFSHLGKSLSVYGVSVAENGDGVPRWDMTLIDDFELMLSN